MNRSYATLIALFVLLTSLLSLQAEEWKKHVVIPAESGGPINSALALDADGDGHMDVITAFNFEVRLLAGPDWTRQRVVATTKGKPYRNSCIHSCLIDADGDGDLDFVGSNQTVYWLEQPAKPFEMDWPIRTVDNVIKGTHCLRAGDVDGDGRDDLIANSFQNPNATPFPYSITWQNIPKNVKAVDQWDRHVFADRDAPGGNHYMGLGDVNGDGKADIACGAKGGLGFPGGGWFAWWEQSADGSTPWKKHMISDAQPGATNVEILDLNADGKADFLCSRGHGAGLLWFEAPTFIQRDIDPTIAFPHSLAAGDIDGDGDVDAAVCGSKVDGVCAWYENDGKGGFTKHVVGREQSSYDLRLVDMDGDKDLDLLVAGHASKNLVWYENPR